LSSDAVARPAALAAIDQLHLVFAQASEVGEPLLDLVPTPTHQGRQQARALRKGGSRLFVLDGYWSSSGSVPMRAAERASECGGEAALPGARPRRSGAPGAGNPVGDASDREARSGGPLCIRTTPHSAQGKRYRSVSRNSPWEVSLSSHHPISVLQHRVGCRVFVVTSAPSPGGAIDLPIREDARDPRLTGPARQALASLGPTRATSSQWS